MIEAKKFRVTFEHFPEYNAVYQLELHESGAFRYGNQTCVAVLKEGKHIETIDTRYVIGIRENFAKWCEEYTEIFNKELGPSIEWLDISPKSSTITYEDGKYRYFDKNGTELQDGDTVVWDGGKKEMIYRTTEGELGTDATNPSWIESGRAVPCEYGIYTLSKDDLLVISKYTEENS